MKILAMESSTSSAKALLYDTKLGVVMILHKNYGHFINGDPGLTDVEEVFHLTMELGRQLASGLDIDAIALSGIWNSIGIFDRRLNPVTPGYMWNYMGAAEMCSELRKDTVSTDFLYRRTGAMVHAMYPRHILQFLKASGMDFSDKYFMTQGGYNFYRLTGKRMESVCMQSGGGFINLKSGKYDPDVMDMLGLREEQFGILAGYKDICLLSEEGARELGIRAGIPVVPAFPDGALNQVGSGALPSGYMTISVGTSGALRMSLPCPLVEKQHKLWCYHGVRGWISGAATAGACNCINWFMGYFGKGYSFEEFESEKKGMNSNLPIFLPFLFGERNPGWDDRRTGGFVDLRGWHGIPDLYKAMQAGIVFNLFQCYEALVKDVGEPAKIILSGGILNSASWTQMLADVFRKEVYVGKVTDASLMGAVVLGLCACGALSDIEHFSPLNNSERRINADNGRDSYYRTYYARYLRAYEKTTL